MRRLPSPSAGTAGPERGRALLGHRAARGSAQRSLHSTPTNEAHLLPEQEGEVRHWGGEFGQKSALGFFQAKKGQGKGQGEGCGDTPNSSTHMRVHTHTHTHAASSQPLSAWITGRKLGSAAGTRPCTGPFFMAALLPVQCRREDTDPQLPPGRKSPHGDSGRGSVEREGH